MSIIVSNSRIEGSDVNMAKKRTLFKIQKRTHRITNNVNGRLGHYVLENDKEERQYKSTHWKETTIIHG